MVVSGWTSTVVQTNGSCSSKAKPWDRNFKQIKTYTNLKILKILSFTVSDVNVNLQSGAQLWHQANKKVETKYRWFRIEYSGKSVLEIFMIPLHNYIKIVWVKSDKMKNFPNLF